MKTNHSTVVANMPRPVNQSVSCKSTNPSAKRNYSKVSNKTALKDSRNFSPNTHSAGLAPNVAVN
jgi:hypothetical protein